MSKKDRMVGILVYLAAFGVVMPVIYQPAEDMTCCFDLDRMSSWGFAREQRAEVSTKAGYRIHPQDQD